MKNKKKIILTVVSIVLVLGFIAGALALYFIRYLNDPKDTEEAYRQKVNFIVRSRTQNEVIPLV